MNDKPKLAGPPFPPPDGPIPAWKLDEAKRSCEAYGIPVEHAQAIANMLDSRNATWGGPVDD